MKKVSTADRLNQIMNKNNLRQVDILEKSKPYCEKYNIRLGRNDLSQYVSGKVEPGQEKLSILAKALNVTESWLMGLDVPMQEETTLKNIIESRIIELGIPLDDVARKAGVSLHWLQNIDSFVPSEFGDYEIGYDWITKVAEVIGLPGSILRSALARQEIPVYEGEQLSAEEAFKQAQKDFSEPYVVPEAEHTYYLNDETRQIAQDIFDNPDLRSLFSAAKSVSPEQLKSSIDYLKFLKAKERGESDEGVLK